MGRSACFLAALLVIGSYAPAWGQDGKLSHKKVPDGVYAVLRESHQEKDVLPLKDGEVLVVHRHRYLKTDDKEPPRSLVARSAPDVDLTLAGKPKAVKEGEEVVRILLRLQPKAATALDRLGRQITIMLGGEVVTMHKIREVIKGGDVQITSCAAGAANYLLEQLQAHQQNKASVQGQESGDAIEIIGEWKMIKSVVSGKESPDDVGIIFTFTKDKLTISDPKNQASDAGTRKYTLRPEKKPAEIDVQRESAKRADPGIYKLEKDKLTIAMPEKQSGPRPETFEGNRLVVFTFERVVKKAK
jgi:uncharacterized protein (TIGR03067 family)